MFCRTCGTKLLEGAAFCSKCGAPVQGPALSFSSGGPAANHETGGPGHSAPPPAPPRRPPKPPKQSRMNLWVALTTTAVIIVCALVAVVWLLVLDKGEVVATSTTTVIQTSTTSGGPVVTTGSPPSTVVSTVSTSSTTVTPPLGAPGDSAGRWTEVEVPGITENAFAVAVSEEALLVDVQTALDSHVLYAYLLDSQELIELPLDGPDFLGGDVEARLAVWLEGSYDDATASYSDQFIYAYLLPGGPKVKIAGGDRPVYYPQIAGEWITWVEEEPWEENPEEYWFVQIYGVQVDAEGNPRGEASQLVPAATGYAQGDATWVYSLSATHLTWENATTVKSFQPGIYAMDLSTREPLMLGSEIWRPSTAGGKVVYTDAGLMTADLTNGTVTPLDPSGDFATAGPTYAVYFRPIEREGTTLYDIVARGYTGSCEQALGSQEDPPWFSPFLAASASHVAFITGGRAHLFEWRTP